MTDYAERARIALGVYLERGVCALHSLECERFDEADEVLNWRRAAFYNFKAADFLALKAGTDIGKCDDVSALWQAIKDVDRRLEGALTEAKRKNGAQLKKVAAERRRLKSYRSGETNLPALLERSV